MGTIFKYNNQLIQCQNLQKKLKKMHIDEKDIEIIKDGIPSEELEKTFVLLTNGKIKDKEPKIEKEYKFYYYTDGINFTGVFRATDIPPQKSELSWCYGWELKEGTPDISRFGTELQNIFKSTWS